MPSTSRNSSSGGVQGLGEGAEAGDQRLGERLGVAPRRGAEQDQLEQLVVGQGVGARLAEASPSRSRWPR